jgi:thiol-disulfide isomerase/thioredoxin
MKKIFEVVILICLLIATFASSAQISLEGKLTGIQQNYFLIEIHNTRDTIRLDENGTFSVDITQGGEGYYKIYYGRSVYTLYLLEGGTTRLENDPKTLSAPLQYSGVSGVYCDYLRTKEQNNRTIWSLNAAVRLDMEPEKFIHLRDSIRTLRNALLLRMNAEHPFKETFLAMAQKENDFIYGSEMITFGNVLLKNGKNNIDPLLQQWNKLNWNDGTMAWSPDFQQFVKQAVQARAATQFNEKGKKEYADYCFLQIETACKEISNRQVKDAILPEVMGKVIDEIGTRDLSSLVEMCCKNLSSPRACELLRMKAAAYSHLYPSKASPDFTAYDTEGKSYGPSQWRGKVVYIDVWATWCGPCKKEIPELQKLEEEYKNREVQFVSISTDRDEQAWINFLKTQPMGGLQLHQANREEGSISKAYIVNSIPRFILLNRKGEIVSADAPRPSSGEVIKALLEKTLSE